MFKRKEKRNYKLLAIIGVIILIIILFSLLISALSKVSIKQKQKVVILPISGVLQVSGGENNAGITSVQELSDWLEQIKADKQIKAIILEINSPGGGVVASMEISDKLRSLNLPTVAWIRDMGLSGGYWVASSSDYIIAHPASLVGSIGTTAAYLEFAGLLQSFNITYRNITSGKYKDLGSPLKELSGEEEDLLHLKINKLTDIFVNSVSQKRNLTNSQLSKIKTGEYFLGIEAIELNLVDELGSETQVLNKVASILNTTSDKLQIIPIKQKKNLLATIYGNEQTAKAFGEGFGKAFFERIELETKGRGIIEA